MVGGTDRLPELLVARIDEIATEIELPRRILDTLNAVPSYYLRYYYEHDPIVEELRHRRSRAEEVSEVEAQLLEAYRDPALHDKPELLAQRGGAHYSEAALDLLGSLFDDRGDVQVLDVRNSGAIAELPDDAVVEVPARVGRSGPVPLPVAPLPPHMAGLTGHVAAYEQLAVQAAISGDRGVALEAMLTHPLIGQLERAEALLDALLTAHRAYLPAFE
jgi:6-phospho-beta-glucosidase